jgi:hypothetical protein
MSLHRAVYSVLGACCGAVVFGGCNAGSGGGVAPEAGGPDSTIQDSGVDSLAVAESSVESAAGDSSDAPTGASLDASDAGIQDAGEGGTQDVTDDSGEVEGDAACKPFDTRQLDEASVAAGRMFIETTGHCYRCHQAVPVDAGIALSGNDNTVVDGGMVYPPNLTPDPGTGLGCWTNDQIATAILYGIDNQGLTLCGVMPRWGLPRGDAAAPLNDASVYNVVEFLRSLPGVVHQVSETTCPASSTITAGDGG